jgi:signal transduction histidine kinase/CheY-like chemotaxis protein
LEDIKDSGLQYMRAMGTIILSAILKKDIMLADKAKSHFISNISHELRTPLHGILAAAELLAETKINATQGSYLETVEACGKSLLELVNHVLDFTKLSGNVHAKQSALKPSQQCDLVKLVQEVCESSWIGQMAKNLDSQQHAGIGSAYAKGSEASSVYSNNTESDSGKSGLADISNPVETVIDVSMRQKGWLVNCDAGGIRRVLMNLIGNSLKFTQKGFVHVSLREVQSTETHVLIELGVTDTGKGISRAFLEEQLFHPFTQENHLGPGTGLGLSIVNSIVQSPAINGKIDVWSTVGQGTEIRVTCELELSNPAEAEGTIYRPVLNVEQQRSITFLGFDDSMRGQNDLKDVMRSYYEDWWRFRFCDDMRDGDIILINDNYTLIRKIMKVRKAPLPPIILLASARGGTHVSKICDEYQEAGGVVRQLFKPAGPAKLEAVTDFCLQCFERGFAGLPMVDDGSAHSTPLPSPALTSRNQSGGDYFTKDEVQDDADAETPRGPIATKTTMTTTTDTTTEPAAGSPRPGPRHRERPGLTDDLRRNSHHISPGPPSASDAVLLRRHSSEGRKKGVDGAAVLSDQQARDEEIEHAAHTSIGAGSNKGMLQPKSSSRPLMPTRSITYHEPRLQRHVLMSPLRSPHYRRGEGTEQQMDYFGPAAATSVSSLGNAAYTGYSSASFDTSGPSSPGSVISLEGGEGAVLRSAINNAGLVRNPSGQPSQHKKRLQILSVEDNSINRRVLAAFFGKMEVDLVEATNGEEGVRAFESHPPFHFDVIFMDLSMPVLDGIGAMMQIRKIEADRFRAEQSNTMSWIRGIQQQQRGTGTGASSGKSTGRAGQASTSPNTFSTLLSTPGGTRPSAQARAKIFALTGRSSDEDKRRAFSTGADGFIVKPLSYKVLSTLINTISAYR